jgi:hypothetical protein
MVFVPQLQKASRSLISQGKSSAISSQIRGRNVFIIGKTLELIGMAFLGAGLYIGCVNPYGLSEGGAMGAEIGSLVAGILIFFIGRVMEKH